MKIPNLELVSEQVSEMISHYGNFFPFGKDVNVKLESAPSGKGYSAIGQVPLGDISNAVFVLLGPGDGTGAYTEDFPEGSLIVPSRYQFGGRDFKFYPRMKDGMSSEIMIPVGSVVENKVYPDMVALKQLGVDGKNIVVEFEHGHSDFEEKDVVYFWNATHRDGVPFPYSKSLMTTLWTNSLTGKKEGDPHAIFNHTYVWQVACFIGFEDRFPENVDGLESIIRKPAKVRS